MIDDSDPRVGPPRLQPGDTARRWTVVRLAAPGLRRTGVRKGKPLYQRRVVVRCICQRLRRRPNDVIVWEKDVLLGRSWGCRSRQCMDVFREEVGMQVRKATIEDLGKKRASFNSKIADAEAEIERERQATAERIAEIRAEAERQVAEAEAAVRRIELDSALRIGAVEADIAAFERVIQLLKEDA